MRKPTEVEEVHFFDDDHGSDDDRPCRMFEGMAGPGLRVCGCTQTFQNPLVKEYTLNYSRIPNMN